jgi:hypothetical protein
MTFFRFLSIATILVPILLFLGIASGTYYYKFLEKKYRFLLLYLIICLVTDILSRIAGEFYDNNLIFIIIFSLFELVFFTVFYQACVFKRKKITYSILTFFAATYILYEMYILKDVLPKDFQPYSKVICSFIIIVMAINYFFEKINTEQEDNSGIKLNSVFVVYFSLNLIFFLPVNFLINVTSSVKFYFWCANFLLTISFYTFLGREIWKNGSIQKRLHYGL